MLVGADEIRKLKNARIGLERGMENIEAGQRPLVSRLSRELEEMIGEIESMQEKADPAHNPALSTRIKLSKKGMLIGKEIARIEMAVVNEFDSKGLSEDSGKRFVSIIKLIRSNALPAAKRELGYFREISSIFAEWGKLGEELAEIGRSLKKERARAEMLLEEMSNLEKEAFDGERARRHEELLENIEKLKKMRADYIQSLVSMPIAGLLEKIEKYSLKEYYGVFPEKDEIARLGRFFSDYPELGELDSGRICELFGYNEKKLAHVCPETTRFRQEVMGSREFFETLGALGQTSFLAVGINEDKILEFYLRNIDGAQEAVGRIRQLAVEKDSNEKEYEKKRRIEKRREELAKYSKAGLEAELGNIRKLMEALDSGNSGQEPAGQAERETGGGLLFGIGEFVKKLSGKQ